MNSLLLPILLAVTADPTPAAPLTIGSPAPKLATMTYLRGEAVKELAKGTAYVIEFSGTYCAPCIKCIPHMNGFQKTHADVVFISVFCEDEKTVRSFLEGRGKAMAIRVAADPQSAMQKTWSDPACQEGVPHCFIVGKDGRIAWIGHPEEMAEPLAGIVAGTFNAQEHVLRLKVEQGAVERVRRREAIEEKGFAEYNRINQMIIVGKLDEALAATEKALPVYREAPQANDLLRNARVYLLANLPGKREQAFELATELAIEAKISGRSATLTNTAVNLLNAAERAKPAERDTRLIDLALALLREEAPAELRGKPAQSTQEHQILCRQFTAYAYHLRGDPKRATAAVRDAIAAVRALKPPSNTGVLALALDNARRVMQLEETLKEYQAGPPEKR